MKAIPVLGIPHYNRPDLTIRCIESIDYPVTVLVLVFNRLDGQGDLARIMAAIESRREFVAHAECVFHPNAGVAGAWNEIIKLFPADWWMIVNNDIQFTAGDLGKLAEYVRQNAPDLNLWQRPRLFYGNHGASWFALTAGCVQAAGLFDENFYPAYDEDCDYARRCDLLGVQRANVPDVHAIHGEATDPKDTSKGSSTIMSDPEARAKNGRTHGSNNEYYQRKWGGLPGRETFTNPFNELDWPVWAWRFEPAMRAQNQW